MNIPKAVVRPAAFCCRDFFLLHDNAPVQMLQMFAHFWPPPPPKKNYNPLLTPYSPDLRVSPSEYFLLRKLKMKLKGLQFADVAEI
jgi:hypothetical protein